MRGCKEREEITSCADCGVRADRQVLLMRGTCDHTHCELYAPMLSECKLQDGRGSPQGKFQGTQGGCV
eukprot:1078175-Pelagomonas_calceolata.AAC.2